MTLGIGSSARLAYGYEASFGAGGTTDKAFGGNAKLTEFSANNNATMYYEVGSRVARRSVALRFEGSWGVDAILSNSDWINAVLWSTDGTVGTDIKSLVIDVGFNATDRVLRTLKGAVVTEFTMSTRVNEPVSITYRGLYATEELTNPIEDVTPVLESTDLYTFAGATVSLAGSQLSKVQNAEITFRTNNELVYEVGTRIAGATIPKAFEISGRFSAVAQTDDIPMYVLGLGALAGTPETDSNITDLTFQLQFTNGTNTITVAISGFVFLELGSVVEANEMILYDADFVAKDVTITVV